MVEEKNFNEAIIVTVSSMAVCDDGRKILEQTRNLKPNGTYGKLKLEVENQLAQINLQKNIFCCGLRLPGVFAGDDDSLGAGTTECLTASFNEIFDGKKSTLPIQDDIILPMALKSDVIKAFEDLIYAMQKIKDGQLKISQEEFDQLPT